MRNSSVKTLIAVLLIIMATIVFHFLGYLKPVENGLRSIIQPGSRLLYILSVQLKENQTSFSTADEFIAEYERLKKREEEFNEEKITANRFREENFELREQLKFSTSSPYAHIGAEVIGKNIEPLGSTLVLSRGEADGVRVDDPVIVRNGIFIGKIVRVEKNISLVRLIHDHQSRVAATVMNQDKSIGLVEGGYGISVRMNFIPQNEQITPGDVVITSGLERQVPRGLIIGTVETVEKESYEPFQRAVLTPPVDLEKIYVASILIGSEDQAPL